MNYDLTMAICGVCMFAAMAPQLARIYTRRSAKDFSYVACFVTAVPLGIVAYCQLMLSLPLSAVTSLCTALCWGNIAVLKYYYSKQPIKWDDAG